MSSKLPPYHEVIIKYNDGTSEVFDSPQRLITNKTSDWNLSSDAYADVLRDTHRGYIGVLNNASDSGMSRRIFSKDIADILKYRGEFGEICSVLRKVPNNDPWDTYGCG